MGNFIQTILCCIGDSNDHLNDNTHSQSNQRIASKNNSNVQSGKSRQLSTSPNTKQLKSKQVASASGAKPTNNQNSTKMQKSSTSSSQDNNKTDVTVYEATDSTIETGNYDQVNDNDYEVTTSYVEKNNSTTQDTDMSSNDDPVEEEEYNDELFDLTKLQPGQAHAESGWLLNPKPPHLGNKKCLILDLDETLVHSSFKYLRQADFVIPVDIENQLHNVYVIKRPGVDEFMKRVGELYEIVIFTASVSRYGDPLLDALDIHKSIHHRLFRDSCYNYQGNYIKNLSQIGRPLNEIIILDNSPASYIFHPQHAIPISSWFSDAHDNELLDIIPFLEDLAKENVEDVGLVLDVNL